MLPSFFRGRRSALGAVAVTATLGLGGIAVADNLLADGDGLAPVGDNNMSFGTVACNSSPSKDALLAIVRTGEGTNVFKNSSTATITIHGISGENAGDLSASVLENAIAVPDTWSGTGNNVRTTDTATATVTPSTATAGSKSATIEFRATGVNGSNQALTRSDDMTVTWTVDTCNVADTTAPTASASAVKGVAGSQSAYDGSWTNQDVAVTLNAQDNRSGVQVRYTLDGSEPTATHGMQVAPGTVVSFSAEQDRTLKFVAVDAANNVSSVGTQAIKIDKTRPTISAARHGSAANSAGWNNAPVTVRFTCGDTGGSGLAAGACPSDEVVSGEGRNQSRSGSVTDLAGNAAAAPASVSAINIDTTAPVAPAAARDRAPEDAADDWFKDTVTVTYSGGSDPDLADRSAGSGIVSRSAAQTFSTTGSHSYAGTATDAAGNTTAAVNAVTGTVKVDATRPVVVLTDNCPVAGTVGEPVSASWQASDLGSGLDSAATGSISGTLTLGSTSLSAAAGAAIDKVGHESVAVSLCTVRGTYAWSGFLAPLANQGVNAGKTGRTYPVKWRLMESVKQADGTQKLEIISDATGIALAQQMSFAQSTTTCASGAVLDPIDEEAPAGATTSVTYDTDGDQFQMNYKAPSTQGCYRLMFYKFNGLQAQPVDFKFTK